MAAGIYSEIGRISEILRAGSSLRALQKSIESRKIHPKFPQLSRAILEIEQMLHLSGVVPMRVVCTHWTQIRDGGDRELEVSWVRGDLQCHNGRKAGKVPRSHGSGLRLKIYGDGRVHAGFNARFDTEGQANFRRNLLQDNGYLAAAMKRLSGAYWVVPGWVEYHDGEFETFSGLRKFAKNCASPNHTYFYTMRSVTRGQRRSYNTFVTAIHRSFLATLPFMYGHLFPTTPKKAGSLVSMRAQVTREKLRDQMLRLESQCQRTGLGCKVPRGHHGGLKVAHLKRGINSPDNAVLLCSHCESLQHPAASDIRVLPGKKRHRSGTVYTLSVPTRQGAKQWKVLCAPGHTLKNYRSG